MLYAILLYIIVCKLYPSLFSIRLTIILLFILTPSIAYSLILLSVIRPISIFFVNFIECMFCLILYCLWLFILFYSWLLNWY